jgi:hypothetical protein
MAKRNVSWRQLWQRRGMARNGESGASAKMAEKQNQQRRGGGGEKRRRESRGGKTAASKAKKAAAAAAASGSAKISSAWHGRAAKIGGENRVAGGIVSKQSGSINEKQRRRSGSQHQRNQAWRHQKLAKIIKSAKEAKTMAPAAQIGEIGGGKMKAAKKRWAGGESQKTRRPSGSGVGGISYNRRNIRKRKSRKWRK